jgi:cytochrome c biogenesis protein CcdA
MILLLLAYLGGVLTIVSPCILPVLPFVFARSDRPFLRRGLPLLAGMAVTFALVASLVAIGGGWAVAANQYGRIAAIILLAFFGLTLLLPSLADRLSRPLVALGARFSDSAQQSAAGPGGVLPSFLLGIATGLLWAPCAGPILGLILTGAALQGVSIKTSLLLLAYAAGAATSLALALLIGGRVFQVMKRWLGTGEWVRRGLGVGVLAAVAVIALGLDTGLLTRASLANTATLEQSLLDRLHPAAPPAMQPSGVMSNSTNAMMMMSAKPAAKAQDLPVEGALPSLAGAVQWLNSPPLTPEALKGKVVLVDFWTYSCINCLRAIPYVRAWPRSTRTRGWWSSACMRGNSPLRRTSAM